MGDLIQGHIHVGRRSSQAGRIELHGRLVGESVLIMLGKTAGLKHDLSDLEFLVERSLRVDRRAGRGNHCQMH